jgi:hypothetical protein
MEEMPMMMMEVMLPIRLACLNANDAENSNRKNVAHDLGRVIELPTLPTRPLVLRTLVLPSVLRRAGLDRIFPTLMLPCPLLLLSLGVFGRPLTAGAVFSASLPSPKPNEVCVTDVWMTDVVLNARRVFSFAAGVRAGERDDVLRAIWRK